MRCPLRIKPQSPGYASGHRVCQVRCVVESLLFQGYQVNELDLDRVGQRQGQHEDLSVGARVLRRREHRSKVVAWVARLLLAHVVVHEVEVSQQRSIMKCGPVRRGTSTLLAAPNQRAPPPAPELIPLLPNPSPRLPIERPNATAYGVQNPDLELFSYLV